MCGLQTQSEWGNPCWLQVSAFYMSKDPPRNLVRFCFCKTDEKLQNASKRLHQYFSKTVHAFNGQQANGKA